MTTYSGTNLELGSEDCINNGTVCAAGNVWPGIIMISYSLLGTIAHGLCLVSIGHTKSSAKNASFRIIAHLAVVDTMQLVLNGIGGGIISVTQNPIDPLVNKILGGVVNAAFILSTVMADLLAINRYLQICRPNLCMRIFSLSNTNVILAVCWGYGLAWLITYMCPDLDFFYLPIKHCWHYSDSPPSHALSMVELAQDSTHCTSMVLCYALIFRKLLKKAKEIQHNGVVPKEKKENLVLLQSIWTSITTVATVILFFSTPSMGGEWTPFVMTLMWLTDASSNAFIYLIFNKKIRDNICRCRWRRGDTRNTAITYRVKTAVTPTTVVGQ